jgi:hypothetical protein
MKQMLTAVSDSPDNAKKETDQFLIDLLVRETGLEPA